MVIQKDRKADSLEFVNKLFNGPYKPYQLAT